MPKEPRIPKIPDSELSKAQTRGVAKHVPVKRKKKLLQRLDGPNNPAAAPIKKVPTGTGRTFKGGTR